MLAAVDRHRGWCPDIVRDVDVLYSRADGHPSRARMRMHIGRGTLVREFDLFLEIVVERPGIVRLMRVTDPPDQPGVQRDVAAVPRRHHAPRAGTRREAPRAAISPPAGRPTRLALRHCGMSEARRPVPVGAAAPSAACARWLLPLDQTRGVAAPLKPRYRLARERRSRSTTRVDQPHCCIPGSRRQSRARDEQALLAARAVR